MASLAPVQDAKMLDSETGYPPVTDRLQHPASDLVVNSTAEDRFGYNRTESPPATPSSSPV